MYMLHLADFLAGLVDRHPDIVREWERSHVFTCARCGHNRARAVDDAEPLRDRQLSLPLVVLRR